MPELAADAITKHFGGKRPAHLASISLTARSGEIIAIVGPSGAGKTTLLRILAGLITPDSGRVLFDGVDCVAQSPQDRRFALLFYDDALVPMLTVRSHLEMVSHVSPQRFHEIIALLEIEPLLARRAGACSGGERQRIALARALVAQPRAMLYDEPLAHVDPPGRTSALAQVVLATRAAHGPAYYVTHDHAEAMTVGASVAVLMDGRIEQVGAPQAVYDAPANTRVARFFGEPAMNVSVHIAATFGMSGLELGFRPQDARLEAQATLRGRVSGLTRLGSDVVAHVDTGPETLNVRVAAHLAPHLNELVGIEVKSNAFHRFDAMTGDRLA